jgi:hypothetical protein
MCPCQRDELTRRNATFAGRMTCPPGVHEPPKQKPTATRPTMTPAMSAAAIPDLSLLDVNANKNVDDVPVQNAAAAAAGSGYIPRSIAKKYIPNMNGGQPANTVPSVDVDVGVGAAKAGAAGSAEGIPSSQQVHGSISIEGTIPGVPDWQK